MDNDRIGIETMAFLRQLREFSEQNPIEITENTVECFIDVVQCIEKLIAVADIIPTNGENSSDFSLSSESDQYDMSINGHEANGNEKIYQSIESITNGNYHDDGINQNGCGGNGTIDSVAYSPDAQLVSQPPFKYDASHVIRVENIPWTITKKSIVLFFANFNVLNDEDGVHFIVDNVTNHNNAFIQLASSKDVQAALNREQLRVFKFLCKIKIADHDQFMDLINNPLYPLNQRVIRLKEVPLNCTAQDIQQYFNGRSTSEIHLIHNDSNQFIGEVFVMFKTVKDIEMALGSVVKENKKICDKHVKVYRSSQEQFQTYTSNSNIKSKMSMRTKNGEIVPMENLASSNQPAPDSSIAMDDVNDLGAILAVGFAWKVTKADIIAFFADVDIIGGNDGIQIRKNGAMEAVFFVYTKVDVQNALAHDKRSDGSRRIHVSRLNPKDATVYLSNILSIVDEEF